MQRFVPEAVPEGLPDDVSDWLLRQFYNIRDSIDSVHDLDASVPYADKTFGGLLRYFPNGPTGVEAASLYFYHSGSWNFIV